MKIQINQNAPLFLTSDFHHNHANIIKYCSRPFKNVEEMNESLISKWNQKVPQGSTVIHFGDFSFSQEDFKKIPQRLNGNIIWVKGNHDKFPEGFRWFEVIEFRYKDHDFFGSHYAHRVWNKSHHGTIHLYGHSHGTLPDDPAALSMDVGIDCHPNYEPFSFEEVLKHMEKKTFKPIDHHGEK